PPGPRGSSSTPFRLRIGGTLRARGKRRVPRDRHRPFYQAMAVRTQTRVSPTNLLLTALPPREYKRLAPHLELVSFAAKHALYPPSKAITHVYFPENAVISIVLRLKDGRRTEVGMVGNEGIVGLCALFGDSV